MLLRPCRHELQVGAAGPSGSEQWCRRGLRSGAVEVGAAGPSRSAQPGCRGRRSGAVEAGGGREGGMPGWV